jgi:hypothetical protein
MVTTWLRRVIDGPEGTIHESVSKRVLIDRKRLVIRQVSNLGSSRETDFDSVVVTTWLRPINAGPEVIIHESISKRVLMEKDLSFARFRT